jgi:alkylation response protein AidB-like acyl-CoA dehydrogenase
MFMLARTDPDAPKHRGITYFLLDMKSPGVTVRPLINMANGHQFNEVFFEDVRVPARNVLGEVNRGWYIGTTTLDFERSSIGNAVGQRQTLEYYMKFWKENRGQAVTGSASAKVKDEFADRWIEAATAKMLSYRVITIQAEGRVPNHEASIAKLFNTELSQRIARTAMKLIGTNALLMGSEAPMKGRAPSSYLQTVSSTIAGGTSEVQRNIVATRGLGLPRA